MLTNNVDIRDAFFEEIYEFAAKDINVIFITADADAFCLRKYKNDFPKQFINVGVAEQNMVTVAAGLALSGKKVFIYAIIPFITMRCYEHIKVNICSMNLPITIVGAGAGLAFGNDGPTHHAIQDIAVMRILPEMTIMNPCDSASAAACARIAYQANTPVYVRLDKGEFPSIYDKEDAFYDGLKVLKEIKDINIISTGFMSQQAIKVFDQLKENSIDVGIVDIYRIKPINEALILKLLSQSKYLVTIEENSVIGGIGTIMGEVLIGSQIKMKKIALKDQQCFAYGSREWLHSYYGLDVQSVSTTIRKWIYAEA